jgi:hypothetical protein
MRRLFPIVVSCILLMGWECRAVPHLDEEAVARAMALAERSLEKQQYGACLSFCMLLRRLCDAADAPSYRQESLRKAEVMAKEADNALARNVLPQSITVGDFKSLTAGVGPVYRKELENALMALLRKYACAPYIFLARDPTAATALGYVITDAAIGVFELLPDQSRALPPQIQFRSGQYHAETGCQEVIRQTILGRLTIRTVETPARLSLRSPEGVTELQASPQFRKEFLWESSPTEEQPVAALVAVQEPRAPAPPPLLRTERPWTDGEMLDEANRHSVQQLAQQIALVIQNRPIFLAEKALRPRTEPLAALELLGEALHLCERIEPETAQKQVSPSEISLVRQFQSLSRLKKNIQENIFSQTIQFIQ